MTPAPSVALVMRSIRMKPPVRPLLGVGVEGDRLVGRDGDGADFVELERLGGAVLERVDVGAELEVGDRGRRRSARRS